MSALAEYIEETQKVGCKLSPTLSEREVPLIVLSAVSVDGTTRQSLPFAGVVLSGGANLAGRDKRHHHMSSGTSSSHDLLIPGCWVYPQKRHFPRHVRGAEYTISTCEYKYFNVGTR